LPEKTPADNQNKIGLSYLNNFANNAGKTVRSATSVVHAGKTYQYVDNNDPMRGGMKDVYFGPDRSYVIAFYRDKQDFNSRERLKKLVTQYYESFFNREGGDYYKELYCWPTDMVEANGKVGLVVPTYNQNFFFKKAMPQAMASREKKSKAFGLPRASFATKVSACDWMKASWETG
jgi:hypothetical protein